MTTTVIAPVLASMPDDAAGRVVLAHLAEHVRRLVTNDPRVRADEPDAVHQMRVASRRLRSALVAFRPLFDHQVTDPLRDELRWLGAVLGEARDAEVIRDHLRGMVAEEPAEPGVAAVETRIVRSMNERYRQAHGEALAAFDGPRYLALRAALDRLITDPPFTGDAARAQSRVLLPLVAKTYRRIGALHRRSERDTAALDHDVLLHEIRKAAKRARYAGEALVAVHGSAAQEWAARMEDIQEILGAHQDTVVTREHVRRLATEAHLAGEDTFTYGRLHALEQARATTTAQAYQRIWLRASQPELHQWLKP